ncbi:FeoB-associated Cys-rich membrane protein [Bacillus pfraonensis]
MEHSTSLAIFAVIVVSIFYLIYRIDVWDKKTGWSQDE